MLGISVMCSRSGTARALIWLLLLTGSGGLSAQSIGLVGGTPATETFDTLASSGTGSTLPAGWHFLETGNNANGTYAADDGTANAGNTYSYGAAGSGERALGLLRSGSLVPTIGAHLRNDSGAALAEVAVAYTGEQWRLGAAGRPDRLQFQYSVNATALGNGTWTDVAALDFIAPVTTGAPRALNGNLAANRTAVSGTIGGLNLAPGASLWVRWVDVDASGADDGLAIDTVSFTVAGDPPPDLPPAVVAVSPANGATNVGLGAALNVTFSEEVTVTAPWFTIQCTTSGSHTATVSGGPGSYTLAPSPAFAANESCTWTTLASGVVDRDGTPDALASDYVVTFTTADPATTPPTVVSTQPADNAVNVPAASDVRVTFSEAVTTSAGAFDLACDAQPIVLGETGSGATRTLTPAVLLPKGAACVFTIDANGVRNAANVPMAASVTVRFRVTDGSLTGYYAKVNTSSPGQLRCTLHATIRGHTAYPYSGSSTSTWTILETAQAHPSNPAQVLDVYRNRLYATGSDRAGTGSGLTYNREHTWPNSLGFPSTTGNLGRPNAPYTDTHMLYLSDTQWNADRGNKPYANCPAQANCGERATEANFGVGGGTGAYPGNSNWVNANAFETWNHRKGDTARAILYMAIRYEGGVDPVSGQNEPNLELTDNRSLIVGTSNYNVPAYMGLLADLLAWHAGDPPDAAEIARNEVIYTFQGNRNPFIDHPEWATRALFESTTPAVCESNTLIFANGFDGPD